MRFGASKSTTASGVSHARRDRRVPRGGRSRGKKPTKRKPPSPASPLATSAASTALAPGIGTTRTPAAIAARTSASPGSLTTGVPASVTSATLSPFSSSSAIARARRASVGVRVQRLERLAGDAEVREQRARAPRVLGDDRDRPPQRLDRARA